MALLASFHIAVELRRGRLELEFARDRGPMALRLVEQHRGALRVGEALSLHTDNLPKNIYDSLALCNKKDLPLIQDIVENFVSKRE